MLIFFPDQHSLIAAPTAGRAYANHSQVGGSSSTFGLICLDDLNTLASMLTDGAPFFSTMRLGRLQTTRTKHLCHCCRNPKLSSKHPPRKLKYMSCASSGNNTF